MQIPLYTLVQAAKAIGRQGDHKDKIGQSILALCLKQQVIQDAAQNDKGRQALPDIPPAPKEYAGQQHTQENKLLILVHVSGGMSFANMAEPFIHEALLAVALLDLIDPQAFIGGLIPLRAQLP